MWKTVSGWIKSGFFWVKDKLSIVASKISWPATLAIFFALVPLALCAIYWFFGFAVSSLGIATISTGLTWKTALICGGIAAGLGLAGGCVAQVVKNSSVKAQKKKIEQLEDEEKELKKEKKKAKEKLFELEHGRKKKSKKKSDKEKKEKEERQKKAKQRLEKRRSKKKGKRAEKSYSGYGYAVENSGERRLKNSSVKTNLGNWRKSKISFGRVGSKKSVKNRYTSNDLTKYRKENGYVYR
ncbi:MAG: hypothetical protein IJ590_02455 [Rickettsiales bacterium]|nr:hypothetical protein [Rickettsiales bacterium]